VTVAAQAHRGGVPASGERHWGWRTLSGSATKGPTAGPGVSASWLSRHARGLFLAARGRALEATAAAWLTAVFVERLVVDIRVWLCDETDTFRDAVSFAVVPVAALIAFVLGGMAFLVNRESAGAARHWSEEHLRGVSRGFAKTAAFAAALLALGMLAGALRGLTIQQVVASELPRILANVVDEVRVVGLVTAIATACVVVGWLFVSGGRPSAHLGEAYREWVWGAAFIGLQWVVFTVIYASVFGGAKALAGRRHLFWTGFLKDTGCYFAIAALFGGGLYRLAQCLPRMGPTARGTIGLAVVGAVLACALPALVLDHLYIGNQSESSKFTSDYPAPWQRSVVIDHVHARDWLLLVAPIVAGAAWFIGKVAYASDHRGGRYLVKTPGRWKAAKAVDILRTGAYAFASGTPYLEALGLDDCLCFYSPHSRAVFATARVIGTPAQGPVDALRDETEGFPWVVPVADVVIFDDPVPVPPIAEALEVVRHMGGHVPWQDAALVAVGESDFARLTGQRHPGPPA
jgi:hypothetical protein